MNRRTFLTVSVGTIISVVSTGGVLYYLLEESQNRIPSELLPEQPSVPSEAIPFPNPLPTERPFLPNEMPNGSNNLPPNQMEVERLHVLHVGLVPNFDEETWTFRVSGLVNNPLSLNYQQFRDLPKKVSTSDFHCVTGWSKLGNKWEGVQFKTLIETTNVQKDAKFATIECESGYATSLPIEQLSREDVLLAYRLDDNELPLIHGGPLRLVVPQKYAYKSAKWVRHIKFTASQELGYWESRGYSNNADPFTEDRTS